MFDEEPLRLRRRRRVARELHSNEGEGAAQSLPMERDFQIAALQTLADYVFLFLWGSGGVRGVSPAVPEHHGSPTVLSLRDRAFKAVVIDWVIFDLHR